ncbi:MAG: phosphatase PAP2 family protein, partial [Actinomycetes bacterium]
PKRLTGMTACELTSCRPAARSPRALRELALLTLLYVGYSAARLVGDSDVGTATEHAETLLRIEQWLFLDGERWANRALHTVPGLAVAASYWYAALHYLVTPAVLVWVYRARPAHYRPVRNALVIGSVVGLVGFTVLPMAPPRMLPGYVDTLATTSGYGWWGADASAPEGLGSLTNELAAMPSLHVGWAFWCAWVLVRLTRDRTVRRWAVLYAAGTALVVVVTANHYVLDAVAGVFVMAIGMNLAGRYRPGRRRPTADAHTCSRTVREPDSRDALAA